MFRLYGFLVKSTSVNYGRISSQRKSTHQNLNGRLNFDSSEISSSFFLLVYLTLMLIIKSFFMSLALSETFGNFYSEFN